MTFEPNDIFKEQKNVYLGSEDVILSSQVLVGSKWPCFGYMTLFLLFEVAFRPKSHCGLENYRLGLKLVLFGTVCDFLDFEWGIHCKLVRVTERSVRLTGVSRSVNRRIFSTVRLTERTMSVNRTICTVIRTDFIWFRHFEIFTKIPFGSPNGSFG